MTPEAKAETLEDWARRVAPTLTDRTWDAVFADPDVGYGRRALLAYVESLARELGHEWLANLQSLANDRPVSGTSELTRLRLVRWTRDSGGSVEATPLGRAVLRAREETQG